MSLMSMLNSDQGEGGDFAAFANTSPLSTQISPAQHDHHDGFNFNSVLPGMRGDDISTLNVDYTALDDLEDGIGHWNLTQGPIDLEGSGSDQSEDTDVEMDNLAKPHQNGTHVAADSEMVESGDKVCYGMLYNKDAVLKHQDMTAVARTLSELAGNKPDHVQKFTLAPKSVPHILLSLPDGEQFGVLRSDMTDVLEPLLKQSPPFELEAVASTVRLREQINVATKPNEAIVQVNINIYGPRDRAMEVGDDLSNRKQWLQKPDFFKAEYEYCNPHHLHFPELESQLVQEEIRQEVSGTAKPRAEEERVKKLVAQVHEALTRASDPELDRIAGDQSLKSKLYEHQQQALSYMTQRESGGIPEKYRLWKKEVYGGQEMYIHRITRTRSPIRPEEMGGGVLADEMGLGKTLSTLALTVRTLEEGKAWVQQKLSEEHTSGKVQRYTHSTLVIVPSALLINNWMDEINEHTGENTLSVLKYHGQGRERDPEVIANSDIVITTYNTLATEVAAKKSLLHKIFWYRVVLDEAHIIRRPQTTFYRTCADLEARSRWCLTGTPIQNRLEDIGALFAFLRADPFHSLAQFRRFICIPFDQGETVARDRLILLYDSLVLRRTLNIISLPGQDERIRELELTEEEKRQYHRTFNILNRYMRTQVGQYPGAGSHGFYRGPQFDSWKSTKFGLFQAHLQLRILCNHGTFQKPFSWKKRDTREELNAEREAFITEMGLRSELMCDGCKQPRPILGSTKAQNNFVENCNHSLCHECLEDCHDLRHCPLCQRFGTMDIDMQDGQDAVVPEDTEGNPHHKDYFNPVGFSTKMNALMLDVNDGLAGSKSIIFSCWTRTLDLVAKHLRAEKIVFVRVDGEILSSKREGIIKRFADDKEVRVLLMTTGTGAFGLNLVAANRIFIIEPQWNPSVENQAIARAIRMKQKEKVQVTRYLIKDTVEQEMQSQQIKKRERAEFGFARKEGETNMVAHPESVESAPASVPEETSPTASLPVSMLLD